MKQIITKNKTVIVEITKPEIMLDYHIKAGAHLDVLVVGRTSRTHDIHVGIHLEGKRASATVVGLIAGYDGAQVKFHTMQHHAAVETTSNLLVKSILAHQSVLEYDGSIVVDPKAQKTDAYQRNENLLLDTTSKARSEPALEILANDVRCTHGATIGTLNEEELWYLSTRGITGVVARDMIATGFLQSGFALFTDELIRENFQKQIEVPYI